MNTHIDNEKRSRWWHFFMLFIGAAAPFKTMVIWKDLTISQYATLYTMVICRSLEESFVWFSIKIISIKSLLTFQNDSFVMVTDPVGN